MGSRCDHTCRANCEQSFLCKHKSLSGKSRSDSYLWFVIVICIVLCGVSYGQASAAATWSMHLVWRHYPCTTMVRTWRFYSPSGPGAVECIIAHVIGWLQFDSLWDPGVFFFVDCVEWGQIREVRTDLCILIQAPSVRYWEHNAVCYWRWLRIVIRI